MRTFMLSFIGCLAVMLFALASSAAAQSLDGCALQGTANFSPGLNSTTRVFSYTFSGTLSGCQSTSGAPESGTIGAGQTLTENVTNEITGATDTVTYQEWPLPSGEGTYADSNGTGRALVTWADGTHSVLWYSTKGSLGWVLTGNVAPSMTLRAVNAEPGDPTEYTVKTTRLLEVGVPVDGLLVFEPFEPTALTASCGASAVNTLTGVTTAGVTGALTIGGPVAIP